LVFGSKTGFSQIVLLLGGSLTQDELYTEIKSNLQKNKEYDELDRFLKLPFSLPQCHQNNKNANKRKADSYTAATFDQFFHFGFYISSEFD
jgi:hypothetical protein